MVNPQEEAGLVLVSQKTGLPHPDSPYPPPPARFSALPAPLAADDLAQVCSVNQNLQSPDPADQQSGSW